MSNTIVTHLYDGILIVVRDGIVKFTNPAAARMFGQPLAVMLNYPLGKPILTSERAKLEIILHDSKLGVAEINVAEVEWQGEIVDLISLRDISDRKQAIQELEASLVTQKKLSQKLEKLATTDSLTDVYNRR